MWTMHVKVTATLFCLLCTAAASAQPRETETARLLVGSTDPTQFGDVLRVIGASTVSSGTGTMNPWVLDSDGDALRDSVTTVSTGNIWTFGADHLRAGGGGGTAIIRLNGASGSDKGLIWENGGSFAGQFLAVGGNQYLDGPGTFNIRTAGFTTRATISDVGDAMFVGGIQARGDIPVTAIGVDNVRIGKRTSFNWPMMIFEDAGFTQWSMHNNSGTFLLHRRDGVTGNPPDDPAIALQIDGNITVGPYGKRILPSTPYGVDIGSQQYKFGALWVGDLFADTLVTIENIGTIDNRWLIGSGNILDEDLSPSATSMVVRYNNYATGTFVYLQKFARTEFIKTTSGATLTNKIPNGSFESGAVTNWSGGGASVSASTTKAFHGEYSMLVDASTNPSVALYTGFNFVTSTTYTVCLNARRTDGATIADNAIEIFMRDVYTGTVAQQTLTDGWVRVCRTAAAGSDGEQRLHIDTNGVDMYVDAVQIEETSTQRPYSEYRSSYTISRNQESGAAANQWFHGDGMFGVGAVAGDGWIDCYAVRGVKSATEQGPGCVVNVRTGSSFNAWAPRAAWGNLGGLYDYASVAIFGVAVGKQSESWLAIDEANGVRGMFGSVKKFGITPAGVATFVEGAVTIDNEGMKIAMTNIDAPNRAYRFTGAINYDVDVETGLRFGPGLYGNEISGVNTTLLTAGVRSGGNDVLTLQGDKITIAALDGTADIDILATSDININPASGNLTLNAQSGNLVVTVNGNLVINGSNGFTGTKTAGACTFTFVDGINTNITGC